MSVPGARAGGSAGRLPENWGTGSSVKGAGELMPHETATLLEWEPSPLQEFEIEVRNPSLYGSSSDLKTVPHIKSCEPVHGAKKQHVLGQSSGPSVHGPWLSDNSTASPGLGVVICPAGITTDRVTLRS